jgi:hypothetical protein
MKDQKRIKIVMNLLNKNKINASTITKNSNGNILEFKLNFKDSNVALICFRRGKTCYLKINHKEFKNVVLKTTVKDLHFKNGRVEKYLLFFSNYYCIFYYATTYNFINNILKIYFGKKIKMTNFLLMDLVLKVQKLYNLPSGLLKYRLGELKKKIVKSGRFVLKNKKRIINENVFNK